MLVIGPLPSVLCQAGDCDATIPAIVGIAVVIVLIAMTILDRYRR